MVSPASWTGSKTGLDWLCCREKPLKSQLSMLSGTFPAVVDHMESMRVAWKNSIGCGATSRASEINDRAQW